MGCDVGRANVKPSSPTVALVFQSQSPPHSPSRQPRASRKGVRGKRYVGDDAGLRCAWLFVLFSTSALFLTSAPSFLLGLPGPTPCYAPWAVAAAVATGMHHAKPNIWTLCKWRVGYLPPGYMQKTSIQIFGQCCSAGVSAIHQGQRQTTRVTAHRLSEEKAVR